MPKYKKIESNNDISIFQINNKIDKIDKITNRHKQLAKQTIKKTDIQKKLLLKLDDDFTELQH